MHIPVLKEEVIHFLDVKKNENFIDCTAGQGGHSRAILERNAPEGKVLAIEWDKFLFSKLEDMDRMIKANNSYAMLKETVDEVSLGPVSGILFDLGFSSFHTEESGRGFSFMRDEPLDMRYNEDGLLTAKEIVNNYNEKNIAEILSKWGEEDYAKRIAKKIVLYRKDKPIERTKQLVEIIEESVPKQKRKIHCATKTFQALRIAVNGEIINLREGLKQSLEVLDVGGRLVVITFHGVEDKEVLKFFRMNDSKLDIITQRAVTPQDEELNKNIRSRSAKLRAAIKK